MAFKLKRKGHTIKTTSRRSSKVSSGNTRSKTDKKAFNILTTALIVVAVGVFAFSLYKIIGMAQGYSEGQQEYKNIKQQAVDLAEDSEYLRVNYDLLKQTNSDFAAWIDIPDTKISYPVVYPPNEDNEFYLHTTFEKQYNFAGSIFLDYRSDPSWNGRNTVLYGHRMNDGSMFAALGKYLEKPFWETHREIHIYTAKGIRIYDIFACYVAHVTDECYTFSFDSDDHFSNWVSNIKSKSNYNTDVSVNKDSKVIMLSTCVAGAGQEDNRIVVFASLKETIPNP